MNGFVTKPVSLERLRDALEQATGRYEMPSEEMAGKALDTAHLNQLAKEIGQIGAVEVVRAFLDDGPVHMAAIKAALARGAIQTVRQEAHALAGTARTVGLMRLSVAASSLQRLSTQALPEEAAVEIVAATFRMALPLAAAWADAHENLAASV
jgi:HPt (histidine-containing phosphotransfer) domain-containing protein